MRRTKTPEQLAEEYRSWAMNTDQPEVDKPGGHLALAFLAGYEAARPKWISVEERLPEPDTFVLAYRWTTGEWVRAECIKRCDGSRRWLFGGTEFFPGCDNISCWFEVPLVPKGADSAKGGRMSNKKPTRGCNLCSAHAKAAKKGTLKESFDCMSCLTSYKASKGKK